MGIEWGGKAHSSLDRTSDASVIGSPRFDNLIVISTDSMPGNGLDSESIIGMPSTHDDVDTLLVSATGSYLMREAWYPAKNAERSRPHLTISPPITTEIPATTESCWSPVKSPKESEHLAKETAPLEALRKAGRRIIEATSKSPRRHH